MRNKAGILVAGGGGETATIVKIKYRDYNRLCPTPPSIPLLVAYFVYNNLNIRQIIS